MKRLAVTIAASVVAAAEVAPGESSVSWSRSFIPPAAPSPTAKPDPKLPRLGRDRHGFPFYHPKQLNRVVRTTAYTHSESDHLAYGPRNAVGTHLNYGERFRSAAADWSVYPLGTQFKIKGEPYTYIVDDYGSALVGTATIDIYHPSRSLMRQWGTRVVEIQVIKWGSSRLSMEKLAERRRYRHCNNMYASLQEQSRHRRNTR